MPNLNKLSAAFARSATVGKHNDGKANHPTPKNWKRFGDVIKRFPDTRPEKGA